MKKRIISCVLALLVYISLCGIFTVSISSNDNNTFVESDEIIVDTENNEYEKVHFYFDKEEYYTIENFDELDQAVKYIVDEFPVENDDFAEYDSYQITISFFSDFTNTEEFKEFADERKSLSSIKEVREFRERLNGYSKQFHDDLIDKGIDLLANINYFDITHIDYSPYVVLKIFPNDLEICALIELVQDDFITSISISQELEPQQEATWNEALNAANASDIVNNSRYTGDSVRIGIYEFNGTCDADNPNLINKNIVTFGNTIDDHATFVTSIAAIIAPEAEYYVRPYGTDRQGIAWFIARNCDIINCSFGLGRNGYRYDVDAIYDYQIEAHFVTVIKSAGNGDNLYITSPGYAYNVITVGGVNLNSEGELTHVSSSCYLSDMPQVKPTVCAIGVLGVPNYEGAATGTSVAAPQVTAYVALLFESNALYAVHPEAVQALLSATAQKTADYSIGDLEHFDEKVGAGMVDVDKMLNNSNLYCLYNEYSEPHSPNDVFSLNVHVSSGKELQVSAAWLVSTNGSTSGTGGQCANEIYVTDYDLLVYNSQGTLVAYSELFDNNVEMIRYNVTSSDTYRIVVRQWSSIHPNNDGDYIAISYDIE